MPHRMSLGTKPCRSNHSRRIAGPALMLTSIFMLHEVEWKSAPPIEKLATNLSKTACCPYALYFSIADGSFKPEFNPEFKLIWHPANPIAHPWNAEVVRNLPIGI
jgi:hypothetical protein